MTVGVGAWRQQHVRGWGASARAVLPITASKQQHQHRPSEAAPAPLLTRFSSAVLTAHIIFSFNKGTCCKQRRPTCAVDCLSYFLPDCRCLGRLPGVHKPPTYSCSSRACRRCSTSPAWCCRPLTSAASSCLIQRRAACAGPQVCMYQGAPHGVWFSCACFRVCFVFARR